MTSRRGRKGEPLAASLLRDVEAQGSTLRWPSPRYEKNPIAFFAEVLGVEYLSDDQRAILTALVKPRARVTVVSGHKMGKDYLAAGLALWWYTLHEQARVRATAVTIYQLRDVLWREVKLHWARSQRGPYPIDGAPANMPQTGLRSGAREVVGFTSEQPEAAAGVSSPKVLYILDEASGVDDEVFEAAMGNMAGEDARVLLLSQGTRNRGFFYDSHHSKRELWQCFSLDSTKSPNVLAGRNIVPGMATQAWLDEQAIDWNAPDGPIWKVRVRGQFAQGTDLVVVPLALVEDAERRWAGMATPLDRIECGFDVAKGGGDDSALACRRGRKIVELDAWNDASGLTDDVAAQRCAARAMQTIRRLRGPREARAVVNVDVGGTIGIKVAHALRAYEREIILVPVHFGSASPLMREYQWMRDHLWFGFERWLREGGAIPPDRKLPAELTAPSYAFDERQRRHVEKKDRLKEKLGRSTDRADACILSTHHSSSVDDEDAGPPEQERLPRQEERRGRRERPGAPLNPYAKPMNPYDSDD